MNISSRLGQEWFGNTRGDVLSGLVVALALIPEAIAFSIIAGVDPKVGLYASFSIAVVIAFAGGRPGMISAATGAMALVMVTLVKEHGLQYLLAATVLTGLLLWDGVLSRLDAALLLAGFVALRVGVNLGAGWGEPVGVSNTAEWWPVERRGFALGAHHTGYPVGAMLSGLVAGFVLYAFGEENWRYVFFVALVVAIPLMWFWARYSTPQKMELLYADIAARGMTPPQALGAAQVAKGQAGRTQRVVIVEHLAAVMRRELPGLRRI